MGRAVISIGYKNYIVEPEFAFRIAEMVVEAEQYEEHGYSENRTHHVWKDDFPRGVAIQFISDDTYRMGKAAGKRDK